MSDHACGIHAQAAVTDCLIGRVEVLTESVVVHFGLDSLVLRHRISI
jgi:hypothetical protein